MVKFKIAVSDPETGTAKALELEGAKAQALIGREVGDVIDGGLLGIGASKLKITGGCDKDGVPMRPDIHGGGKKYVLLSGGAGFKPRRPGERRRVLVRGGMITDETYQINLVILKEPREAAKKPS